VDISTAIVVILIVLSLIGRIGKSAQKSQAKRDQPGGQNPSIPYRQNQSQGKAAREGAPKLGTWKGADSFREMLERLEEAATEAQGRKAPAVNFGQAFEESRPVPKPASKSEGIAATEGMVSTQGLVATEGTVSTQGLASAEGAFSTQGLASTEGVVSTQGLASAEGTVSTQGMASTEEGGPVLQRARARVLSSDRVPQASHGYFANSGELRRAVVMSEVLGKPVSLRKRRAV
jgi:hypothetical protein